ncbi:MAG: hypothetical protein KAV87_04550, partial [Desulfobacteraceae bacterium]|nr:hypothetical protein [Desulfobacteraceae bacterium]
MINCKSMLSVIITELVIPLVLFIPLLSYAKIQPPKFDKGLAIKYHGDKGIENDPEVIFAENFEEGSLQAVKSRWESVKSIEIMSLSRDVPPGSAGKHSLLMTHIGGKGTGGHLYR